MTEQLDALATTSPATCPFDHHSPDLAGLDKYGIYADLRSSRVQRTDAWGGYWILSHASDVEMATLDTATFSSQRKSVFIPGNGSEIPFAGLEFDPPEHTSYRRLFTKAVGRPALRVAEPHIRTLATRLVEDFAAAGGGDFVVDVSTVLPTETIAMVVGLPQDKATRIRELADHAWTHIQEPGSMDPLVGMLMAELEARRAEPEDDFLTWLLTATMQDGRPATPVDMLGILNGLIIAGHETTLNASANLALVLARDPALRARIVADPSIIPAVVEESLRFDSPVQNFARTLTRDVEIDGVTLPAGDQVMVMFGSANYDPAAFEDPEVFDPDRANLKHYSFGWGVHRCVGAALSQLELRILCEVLAPYDFSVVGEPVYPGPSGGGNFSGMSSLHLSFSSPTSTSTT